MLAKTRIKQSFAIASTTYDSVALLQRNVGRNLLQRVGAIGQVDTVVDLGCGTGFLINEILAQKTCCMPEQIIALDIAVPMLQIASNKLKYNHSVAYLCADAEYLPLKSQSADLVISNLAVQWCNLEKVLSEVRRILKPEGQFFFTTFGLSTLHELKSAWREVDDYDHVNAFYSTTQLTDFLQQADFQEFELESRSYISTYQSVWDLMAELKQLGAHTVMAGCNKQFTSKAAMQRMICTYQQQDGNGLIPATFEVIMAAIRA